MQYSSLVAFLSGTMRAEAFAAEIEKEVVAFYADLRATKHGFIDISRGPTFEMTRAATRLLLSAVASHLLSPDAAVYVADCILASDDIEVEDEVIRDALAFLEDDTNRFINKPLWTRQELTTVLRSLD